jgi:hypothetical protein
MPKLTYYVMGSYNMACDECGRGFKAGELKKRWDGAYTCSACWEPRQPQDFVRGVKDNPSVPIARPRTGLPTNVGVWVNNMSWVIPWTNNLGNVIPWTAEA